MVERRSLDASVPVFDSGVLHHVVKRLQALHHPEDAEHRLHVEGKKQEQREVVLVSRVMNRTLLHTKTCCSLTRSARSG